MQDIVIPTKTLEKWCLNVLKNKELCKPISELTVLKGDASNRKYFRIKASNNKSYIVVFSPSHTENNDIFECIAKDWLQKGIRTPIIFSYNKEQGFFLLEDLGESTIYFVLKDNKEKISDIYFKAMSAIHRIQQISTPKNITLPEFNKSAIQKELDLFDEWVVKKLLNIKVDAQDKKVITNLYNNLINNAQEQPVAIMHKDFHSKNLTMLDNSVGILDFQDATIGPVTYDIVSLLRDCYVDQKQTTVYDYLDTFINYTEILSNTDKLKIYRWFDWMGLQRHLKVIGIFIRQWRLNGNDAYLTHIPRIFSYVSYVCEKYDELKPYNKFLNTLILPKLKQFAWWKNHIIKE